MRSKFDSQFGLPKFGRCDTRHRLPARATARYESLNDPSLGVLVRLSRPRRVAVVGREELADPVRSRCFGGRVCAGLVGGCFCKGGGWEWERGARVGRGMFVVVLGMG